MTEPLLVYFSSMTNNTARFVESLSFEALRLPLKTKDATVVVDRPCVLVSPTYSRARSENAVPPQVMAFLKVPQNRENLVGVIGAGNMNFGEIYCLAAKRIADKCNAPLLFTFELAGTEEDRQKAREGLVDFWKTNGL